MRMRTVLGVGLAAGLLLSNAAGAADVPGPPRLAAHDDLGRALDELAGRLHDLGAKLQRHFGIESTPGERPLITFMLHNRSELGLTPEQVDGLERLRADFQAETVRRGADVAAAERALAALLAAEPVDVAQAEARIREIERLSADLRVERVRTIERGKALLTPDQRERLQALLGGPRLRGTRPPGRL